jgi:CTP:phosphocholine cytidylyltransferase-like protein
MYCEKVRNVIISKYEYKDRNQKQKWDKIFKEYEQQLKVRQEWNLYSILFQGGQQSANGLLSLVFL